MNLIRKWIVSIPALTACAGFVGGLVVQALEEVIPFSQGLILFVFIVFVVLAVISIVDNKQQSDLIMKDVRSVYSNIVGKLNGDIITQVQYSSEAHEGDRDIYDLVKANIDAATRSLQIVGFYRPPDLPNSPNRAAYYQAIENLVDRKLHSNEDFLYQRIIQVKDIRGTQLERSQTDEITFKHVKRMLGKRKKGLVDIRLYQMPDILGALSFVIIDERVVIIGIPNVHGSSNDGPRALQQLKISLIITDNQQKEIARRMSTYFRELHDGGAKHIQSVGE